MHVCEVQNQIHGALTIIQSTDSRSKSLQKQFTIYGIKNTKNKK